MKKLILLLLTFYFIPTIQSQHFSYGIILGVNGYDTSSKGDVSFDTGQDLDWIIPNIGIYGEYGFSESMGVKAELTFNKKTLDKGIDGAGGGSGVYEVNCVEISPAFKYDFGKAYRKGFYMIVGPKFILASVKTDQFHDTAGFQSSYLVAGLGMGCRIAKIVDLEAKYDFGLTSFYSADNNRLSGFYVSLNVDLERIINGSDQLKE